MNTIIKQFTKSELVQAMIILVGSIIQIIF